jgi:hypothetical protein
MPFSERASDRQRASADDDHPELPDCLRRAPNGGPRGEGWGDLPPGQAMIIKEVWPPALGPRGDDVFDIEPGWGDI